MHYVSVHAGCEEIDNKIFTASYYTERLHQEMVTSHVNGTLPFIIKLLYNTLPSLCAAGSLHAAQLVSVEQ